MVVGKAHIVSMFEEVGHPYFAIFYKGQQEKGNSIVRNDKDEKEFDFASGKLKFERSLELLGSSEYTLISSDTKDVTRRGGNRVDFKIPVSEGNNNAPVTQQAAVGSLSMDEVETRAKSIATQMFEQLMDKRELADVKAKNTELEKELRESEKRVTDPFNKLVGALAPHSENIIAGIMGRRPAVAATIVSGTIPDAVGEHADNTEEAQAALESFVEAISKAKPLTWISIVAKLTDLIKTDLDKFETALKFL